MASTASWLHRTATQSGRGPSDNGYGRLALLTLATTGLTALPSTSGAAPRTGSPRASTPARGVEPTPTPDALAALPPAQHALARLPADAGLWLALRLTEIEDAFALLDLLVGLYPSLGRHLEAMRGPLEVPALSTAELASRGVAARAPVYASLARLPAPVGAGSARAPTAAADLHALARVVVPVSDGARFAGFAAEVLGRMGFVAAHAPVGADAPRALTGARGLAAQAKVALVAVSGGGGAATLRFFPVAPPAEEQDAAPVAPPAGAASWSATPMPPRPELPALAVLDFATPARAPATAAAARKLSTLALRELLRGSRPAPPSLADQLGQGVRAQLLAQGSLVAVARPEALARLLPDAPCRDRLTDPTGAHFTEVALNARLSPFDWRLRARFAFTPEGRAAFGEAAANDGLGDPRELARAGLGALVLHSSTTAPLVTMPRPAIAGRDLAETGAQLDACGPWAWPLFLARAWPQLPRLALEDAARALGADWLPAAARNLALALGAPSPGEVGGHAGRPLGVPLVPIFSLDGAHEPALARALEQRAAAPSEAVGYGTRTPRLHELATPDEGAGAGPPGGPPAASFLVGVEALPGRRLGVLLADRDASLGWYYGSRSPPAVFGTRLPVGAVHLNLGRLLRLAAESVADPGVRDAVALAASQLGLVGGDLTIESGFLELALSVTPEDGGGAP